MELPDLTLRNIINRARTPLDFAALSQINKQWAHQAAQLTAQLKERFSQLWGDSQRYIQYDMDLTCQFLPSGAKHGQQVASLQYHRVGGGGAPVLMASREWKDGKLDGTEVVWETNQCRFGKELEREELRRCATPSGENYVDGSLDEVGVRVQERGWKNGELVYTKLFKCDPLGRDELGMSEVNWLSDYMEEWNQVHLNRLQKSRNDCVKLEGINTSLHTQTSVVSIFQTIGEIKRISEYYDDYEITYVDPASAEAAIKKFDRDTTWFGTEIRVKKLLFSNAYFLI